MASMFVKIVAFFFSCMDVITGGRFPLLVVHEEHDNCQSI